VQEITRGTGVSRKEEIDDLIAAFDRVVHEDHFNAERTGCPGRPALTAMARDSKPLGSDSLLEHIRHCAACLNELKELRLTMKRPESQ
jgi:hypothetical protein